MEFLANSLAYILMVIWIVLSTRWMINYKTSNPHYLQLIPSIFTTIGVFGTFTGIAYGLFHFDVTDITESIPTLLQGMKNAFLTSIIGIGLSLISSNILAWLKLKIEEEIPPKEASELGALNKLIEIMENSRKENHSLLEGLEQTFSDGFQTNEKSLKALNDQNKLNTDSFNTELKNQFKQSKEQRDTHQIDTLKVLALVNENLTGLSQEIQSLKTEQVNASKIANQNTEKIIVSMADNNKLLQDKFDEFSDLMAKNNTEALVQAMERVITDFNDKMNSLIQKLVQENFQELNNSVQRLNEWQIENKEQVATLINQFKVVSSDLTQTSSSVKSITKHTQELTKEDGHLIGLIEELQSVMIDDTQFKQLIKNVVDTINTLKRTTDEFDKTTNALNKWVRDERNIKKSVDALLSKMQALDKIKSYDNEFWQGTKQKMEEGVSIIQRANEQLSSDVKLIDNQFYKRLNKTLNSLDDLIQRLIQKNSNRFL